MTTPTPTRIDFDAALRSLDLVAMVKAGTDRQRHGRYGCPWHTSDSNSTPLSVKDGRWKCWSCGTHGDALDWRAREWGCTRVEAARRVLGLPEPQASRRNARRTRQEPRPAPPATRDGSTPAPPAEPRQRSNTPVWRDPPWQAAVDRIISEAAETLWNPAGRPALDWLRARGLDDPTISRFRLGFVPEAVWSEPIPALGRNDRGEPRRVWAPRGITFPWIAPGAWYDPAGGPCELRWVGCNVRRLPAGDVSGKLPKGDSKYMALAGSERGHAYPWPEATALGEPVIVLEGEPDALTAWQELGWVCNTASFGGAGQANLHDDAEAFLAACPDWLLLFDQDDAGDNAVRALTRRAPDRCRRLMLPPGVNDLNDLHRSGASVPGWLRSEWERFGWRWPCGVQNAGTM
jgi:DNA primase